MAKKVAVIGSGVVGETLANGFLKYGFEVARASRDPAKLTAWAEEAGDKAHVLAVAPAAAWGEIVVLAVKGTGALSAIELCTPGNLSGKVIIDATNPITEEPHENGVLRFFTDANHSLMETLQKAAPTARFVKAFSCVGNAFMIDPDFGGQKPTMFICGNDVSAKTEVTQILTTFGWESADMGTVEAARAIEPLCILWCIPGFRDNSWSHAFKLLKK